ncbi:hypothetical protein BHE74_00009749 [Ensete ventricosum]|nr:hypothetical protein GW17_00006343 [Ensete ventricosum]RWW81816.1 hypothetical protein BHE74_00009749 [Ensete ventricosum]
MIVFDDDKVRSHCDATCVHEEHPVELIACPLLLYFYINADTNSGLVVDPSSKSQSRPLPLCIRVGIDANKNVKAVDVGEGGKQGLRKVGLEHAIGGGCDEEGAVRSWGEVEGRRRDKMRA